MLLNELVTKAVKVFESESVKTVYSSGPQTVFYDTTTGIYTNQVYTVQNQWTHMLRSDF